jgi:hypothetical protein
MRKTSLFRDEIFEYVLVMNSRRKRSRLGWDVTIGLLLLACGLVLAFRDRGIHPIPGNASLHTASDPDSATRLH